MFASPADLAEAAVTAERGHNVVAALPPCAAGALPILAALGRRLAAAPSTGLRALILTSPDTSADWTEAATRAMPSCRVRSAGNLLRTTRHLRANLADVLVVSPAEARQLVERSVLKTDELAAVVETVPLAVAAFGLGEGVAVQLDGRRIGVGKADEADLHRAVVGRLRFLQKRPDRVRSFFHAPDTRYAATRLQILAY